ncbi:MAG: hypothetical protein OQK82_01250, partial [Candidatus Pacearchaeota archaeon]|nr:hypothetical protein [Candidatus Pacearchaeota archaeon]
LPVEVINRAQKILKDYMEIKIRIENRDNTCENEDTQSQLFSPSDMVIQAIRSLNLNNITPLDALNIIALWQKEVKEL